MNRIVLHLFGFILTTASTLLWTPSAGACQPNILCAPVVPFAAGSQIPASTAAIPVQLPKNIQTGKQAVQVQLLDANGQPMLIEVVADAAPGWQLIKPLKGLKANASYTLRLESACNAPGAVTPTLVDTPFTTGPAAELPSTFGMLQLTVKPPTTLSVWTSAGSCVVPLLAAQAEVALDGAPALAPWLALSRAELWVDGLLWQRSAYGAVPLLSAPAQQSGNGGRNAHSFFVPCAEVPKSADAGVPPGKHHVDLRLYIAGQNVQAPYLWGDVTVECSAVVTADAGSTPDAAVADTSAASTPAPQSKAAGGCAAGPRASGGVWLLIAATVVLAGHRRRIVGL